MEERCFHSIIDLVCVIIFSIIAVFLSLLTNNSNYGIVAIVFSLIYLLSWKEVKVNELGVVVKNKLFNNQRVIKWDSIQACSTDGLGRVTLKLINENYSFTGIGVNIEEFKEFVNNKLNSISTQVRNKD